MTSESDVGGWHVRTVPPPLLDTEIHVWRVALDEPRDWQGLLPLLADDERGRALRFIGEPLQRRYVIGRAGLRKLLAAYLDVPAAALRFTYNAHGKPALADAGSGLHFNLSHAGDLMLCALARRREVGVDLEALRTDSDTAALAQRWFSPCEQKMLQALPPAARTAAFFRIWTRKEAYLKGIGEGLSHGLHNFTVSAESGRAALLHHDLRPDHVLTWQLQDLDVQPEYAASLAGAGRDWTAVTLTWACGDRA